ncbi:MAG TPA: C2 family cysteine protease, partial [Myxococcota bacterium]|nr:C2 family cysteine protease [Myxococcota bacterium]
LEKTVAQHKGSYEEISGGNIGKGGFNFAGATEMFTGKAEGYKNVDNLQEDDILLELGAALEAKRTCTVDSRDMTNNEALSKESTPYNVYGNHAYAVQAVDIDKRTVDLQNPWGSHHVKALPIALFKKFYRGIRIGG